MAQSTRMEFSLYATLIGHNGWVTSLAPSPKSDETLVSGSRDKTLMIWKIDQTDVGGCKPLRQLKGHSHFVQDVTISQDGHYALSASWDKNIRLWDLAAGESVRTFVGHTKDVTSVTLSVDNRQIISASRDKTINLWNTVGERKATFDGQGQHNDWISCVRFSPNPQNKVIISSGWDGLVKVWNSDNFTLENTFVGHNGAVNALALSLEGSLCFSGGRDGNVMMWNMTTRQHLKTFPTGSPVNSIATPRNQYWVCFGTDRHVIVYDLKTKQQIFKAANPSIIPTYDKAHHSRKPAQCLSVAWSVNSNYLFAGYSNTEIRVYSVKQMRTVAEGASITFDTEPVQNDEAK